METAGDASHTAPPSGGVGGEGKGRCCTDSEVQEDHLKIVIFLVINHD